MAKRSARIGELRQKDTDHGQASASGLSTIFRSCQPLPTPMLRQNPTNRHRAATCRVKWRDKGMDSELVDCLVTRARSSSRRSHHHQSAGVSPTEIALLTAGPDQTDMRRVQLRAKAVVDQIYIYQLIRNRDKSFDSRSLSDALDLFMDLLPESIPAVSSTAAKKGIVKKHTSRQDDYQCSYTLRSGRIMKPGPQNVEVVACHCSSSLQQPGRMASDDKPTRFSFKGIKKKLKHAFSGAAGGADQFTGDGKLRKNKKLDSSSLALPQDNWTARKNLEIKRRLSSRYIKPNDAKQSSRTLGSVLASPEHDLWLLSPGRKSQHCSGSTWMRFSPHSASTSSSHTQNGEFRAREMNPRSELCAVKVIHASDTARTMQLNESKDDENDPWTENEALASTAHDFPPNVPNNVKFQEHQSPVSVLEPFFAEGSNSPQSARFQTSQQLPQPLCLNFSNECSFDSMSLNAQTSETMSAEKRVTLSEYLHMKLQSSNLNWNHLSEIGSRNSELLCIPSFNTVDQFLPSYCPFTPRLLLDRVIEALLEIRPTHFRVPPWISSIELRAMSMPLHEVVINKIMTGADFHHLFPTGTTTYDQAISNDVRKWTSWLDFRLEIEQITVDIAEDFLEDCMLEMVLEFVTR